MKRARATDSGHELVQGQHRRDDELEAWVAKTLHLPDLFLGLTSREVRRDRLVAVLLERKILDSHAGKMGGKSLTWRELTQRLYGAIGV